MTKLPRKVSLYLNSIPRPGADALATPGSGYTNVFLPTPADIGLRELGGENRGRGATDLQEEGGCQDQGSQILWK